MPPNSLGFQSRLNRETLRDSIYLISFGATLLHPANTTGRQLSESKKAVLHVGIITSVELHISQRGRLCAEDTSFQGLFRGGGFLIKEFKIFLGGCDAMNL